MSRHRKRVSRAVQRSRCGMGRWEKVVPGKYLSNDHGSPLPPHCWVFVQRRGGLFYPLAYIFCHPEKDRPGCTRWFSCVFQPKPAPPDRSPAPPTDGDDPAAMDAALAKIAEDDAAYNAWDKAPTPIKAYWAPNRVAIMTGTERLLWPAFAKENAEATKRARALRKNPWLAVTMTGAWAYAAMAGLAMGMFGRAGKP
jgi:hypothetical protein